MHLSNQRVGRPSWAHFSRSRRFVRGSENTGGTAAFNRARISATCPPVDRRLVETWRVQRTATPHRPSGPSGIRVVLRLSASPSNERVPRSPVRCRVAADAALAQPLGQRHPYYASNNRGATYRVRAPWFSARAAKSSLRPSACVYFAFLIFSQASSCH